MPEFTVALTIGRLFKITADHCVVDEAWLELIQDSKAGSAKVAIFRRADVLYVVDGDKLLSEESFVVPKDDE